ncbi:hypothetical protein WDU94_003292, partial [Cyamophila willieti]
MSPRLPDVEMYEIEAEMDLRRRGIMIPQRMYQPFPRHYHMLHQRYLPEGPLNMYSYYYQRLRQLMVEAPNPGASHRKSTYAWVRCHHGQIRNDAVKVGIDANEGNLYIGRAWHEGDLLPAKIAPSLGRSFVSWGCAEHTKFEYEVLVADSHLVTWVASSNGNVPPHALDIGRTKHGEPLYVGRVEHAGTVTPGKIHPSHGVLYISWAARKFIFNE